MCSIAIELIGLWEIGKLYQYNLLNFKYALNVVHFSMLLIVKVELVSI